MERPAYPLPGSSQRDTEDGSVIDYVLIVVIHHINRTQEEKPHMLISADAKKGI